VDGKMGESKKATGSLVRWKDDRYNDHVHDDDCGQPDEQAWRDRLAGASGIGLDIDPAETHSRLLTKKQLSDMAWGVRELSKRLGSIRLKLKVRTVFLLTKAHDETLIENTREVAKWLLSPERDVKYTVYVEENLKNNKKFNAAGLLEELGMPNGQAVDGKEAGPGTPRGRGERLRYWTNEMCRARPHTFDFVVTLGGDGTVLYASWLFQRIVPPVLSFALGSLGFLTKFDYEDFAGTLTRSFRDGVTVSLRLRFEGTVMRSQRKKRIESGSTPETNDLHGQVEDYEKTRDLVEELVGEEKEDERTHRPDGTYEILNDIVVDRGPNPSKDHNPFIHYAVLTKSSHVLDRDLRR
jgi:NAD+ kinase